MVRTKREFETWHVLVTCLCLGVCLWLTALCVGAWYGRSEFLYFRAVLANPLAHLHRLFGTLIVWHGAKLLAACDLYLVFELVREFRLFPDRKRLIPKPE